MAGQLIPKSHGRWLLRIYEGRDALTKKRIYKATAFEGNQEEAHVELDRLVAVRKQEIATKRANITVSEFADQWFAVVAENRYTPKTQENYRLLFELYVRPIIGHVNLSDLQPQQAQMIFVTMAATRMNRPPPES